MQPLQGRLERQRREPGVDRCAFNPGLIDANPFRIRGLQDFFDNVDHERIAEPVRITARG